MFLGLFIPKAPATITRWLTRLFEIQIHFLEHTLANVSVALCPIHRAPSPEILQIYVQIPVTIMPCLIFETVSTLIYFGGSHPAQCFYGYLSKAPATISPWLRRLFQILNSFSLSYTLMFLWLYVQGMCSYNAMVHEFFSLLDFVFLNTQVQYFWTSMSKTPTTL